MKEKKYLYTIFVGAIYFINNRMVQFEKKNK